MMRVVKLPLRRVIVEIVGWKLVATGRHSRVFAACLRRLCGVVVSDPHLMRALAGEWELAGQRVWC